MAEEIDLRLARKGQSEPRRGLIEQGKVQVGLARKYAAELDEAGWAPEETDALEKEIQRLESEVVEQIEARGDARGKTASQGDAITEAKKFLRKLRNALPAVLRKAQVEGVSAESFRVGGELGRSVSRISDYLTRIRAPVAALDIPLQRYFRQKDVPADQQKKPSELLDEVKQNLDSANVAQEVALAGIPRETLEIYEAKGRVLEMIEDLNRIAKNAFDGQAELIGQFNKDIILRARQERKNKPTEESTKGE